MLLSGLFAKLSDLNRHFFPLVLYGPNDSGKTVLAETIANRVLTNFQLPADSLLMTSATEFRRRYVTAIKTGSIDDFRHRINRHKVLIIDGIELLKNSEQTCSELIKLIDFFSRNDKFLIVTSVGSPQSEFQFSSQLASRLSSGLVLPLTTPTRLVRRTITEALIAKLGLTSTDAGVELFVDRTRPTALAIYQRLCDFKQEHANKVMDDQYVNELYPPSTSPLRIDEIVKLVCNAYHLQLAEIRGKTRRQAVVDARSIAMYLSRHLLGLSFQRIGDYFGKRDHSTVRHAIQQVSKKMDDIKFAEQVKELMGRLTINHIQDVCPEENVCIKV